MGLYSGGLIIGRTFVSEIWGAYNYYQDFSVVAFVWPYRCWSCDDWIPNCSTHLSCANHHFSQDHAYYKQVPGNLFFFCFFFSFFFCFFVFFKKGIVWGHESDCKLKFTNNFIIWSVTVNKKIIMTRYFLIYCKACLNVVSNQQINIFLL